MRQPRIYLSLQRSTFLKPREPISQVRDGYCCCSPADEYCPWPCPPRTARWPSNIWVGLRRRGRDYLSFDRNDASLDSRKATRPDSPVPFDVRIIALRSVSPFSAASLDHIHSQPPTAWGITFVLTAYLLLITEAIGTYVGIHFLWIAKRELEQSR